MRKAARTVKPNARTGERHTWKDRERRRKEERQRMAAEALIVEDAYQRGYADAIADMRKKKEQRRQRIKKCSLQKKWGAAGMDGGACLGFSHDGDDEPIERCKRCIACTSFDWDEEKERLKL